MDPLGLLEQPKTAPSDPLGLLKPDADPLGLLGEASQPSLVDRALTFAKKMLAPGVQPPEAAAPAPDQAVMREEAGGPANRMSPIARAPLGLVESFARGANRGGLVVAKGFDDIATFISKQTGLPKGGLFEKAAQEYQQNVDFWDKKIAETGADALTQLMGEAAGGAVPGLAEFSLGPAYYGIKGMAEASNRGESPVAGAAKGAGERYLSGRILDALNMLKLGYRVPAMAGFGAAQAAASGGNVAENAGTMALYGLMGPTEGLGLPDIARPARERAADLYARAKARIAKTNPPPPAEPAPASAGEAPLSATEPGGPESRADVPRGTNVHPEQEGQKVTENVTPELPAGERRGQLGDDTLLREKLNALPTEAIHNMILTDPVSGARSRLAYELLERDSPAEFTGISDARGLGAVDKHLGHKAGDDFVQRVVEAHKEEGIPIYRASERGDEFLTRWNGLTKEEADAKLKAVNDRLRNSDLIVENPDGSKRYFTNLELYTALGRNYNEAGQLLGEQKRTNQPEGYVKGEFPRHLVELTEEQWLAKTRGEGNPAPGSARPAPSETGPEEVAPQAEQPSAATNQGKEALPTELHTFPGPLFRQAGRLVGKLFNKSAEGLKRGFAPASLSPEHLQAANTLRQVIGESNRMAEQRAFRLEFPQRAFDKLGVTNKDIPLEDNVGIKTMSALSTGKPLPSELANNKAVQEYVGARERIYDDLIKQIQTIDPNALKTIRENYMPGMWTADSRRAFNMAMDEASQQGLIGEGFNVNEATPDLKRWVRDRTKQLIAEGKGSEPDTGIAYLSKRTLEGKGSFRRRKSFEDIMTGVEFGLEPVSNNPVTLDRLKMAEMQRYLDGNKALQKYQAEGTVKFWSVLKGKPEAGWRIVKDPLMVKYGPPEIETKEYVDKNIYDGLMRIANNLGIDQERLASAGRGRLGYSVQGGDKIVTQQATELSVLAHELGHQIDYRYNLWDRLVDGAIGIGSRGKITQAAIDAKRATIKNELRDLADLSWEGQEVSSYYKQKVRAKAEKMAHLLEAYVHAPDKMQQVTPTVFADFDAFIKRTPELKSLADVDAGIALKELTGKKQLGGFPLLGHYVAKEATADILENYLSQSLYNSKIWGPLFKGYMASANELNQFQLTGFFHAGFTTADAIISANANLVKSVFNLLGGHAKAGDLKKDVLDIKDTLELKTPAMGGEILRSWLDPTHPASERTKNVVRAIELVGGGSRMEDIFRNQDVDKAIADWYGGKKIKGGVRGAVFGTGELLSKPVLEMLVPRQKFGVFSLFVDRIMRDNPGKPIEALAPQLNEAWNRIDARLGQVRYDRLFMDKTVKNLVQGTFRAPGWTGGTIAELGGALKDTATFFRQWQQTGKLPPMTDRQAYAISLAVTTAVINSALQYAMVSIHNMNNPNDKQDPYPESWKDFVAFRTGGADAQGRKNRFWLPTYAKDVYSWATHPAKTIVNKVNPVLSAGAQLYQNKDYYGNQIYDEQKPAYDPDNLQNLAKYLGEQFVPFTIRAMKEQARGTEPLYERAAPVIGITPAPKYLMQSKAENMASDYVRANMPAGGKTLEQQISAKAKQDIRIGQPGEEDRAAAAFEKGDITKRQFKEILRDAGKKPLEKMFKHLTMEQAKRVYAVATPEEKELLETAMTRKLSNARKNRPFKVEDQIDEETRDQLKRFMVEGNMSDLEGLAQ